MPIFLEHLVPETLLNGCFCKKMFLFICFNVLDRPESSQYHTGNFTNFNVTDKVKYNLLTNHFKPDSNFKFPVKFLHGSDRCLSFHWLIEYLFLVYSKINDSVCYFPYIFFGKNNKNKLAELPGFSSFQNGIKLVINLKVMSIMASDYKSL